MQQADFSLPHVSPIELLWADYEVAVAEKKKAYELEINATVAIGRKATAAVEASIEAACDAAYEAAEDVADMILAQPWQTPSDIAIQARVLLARGADPADLFYYRPEDLTRFIQELAARL